MTISPDGETIYTINENSLAQDGPSNTPQSGSKTRLTVYNTATGKPSAEYVVDVDPTYAPKADRGYASLATSPDGNLYALQRGYIPKQGNRAEIYRLDVKGATNVLGREHLNGTEVAIKREKVFDFVDSKLGNSAHPGARGVPESPENVEGMTFAAPPAGTPATNSLSTGSRSNGRGTEVSKTPVGNNRVYLISDNNFSDSQRTVVHSLDIASR